MKLYNSYGKLEEVEKPILLNEKMIDSVTEFVEGVIEDTNGLKRKTFRNDNAVFVYEEAQLYDKTQSLDVGSGIGVCGAYFEFNQVDGRLCNVSYISTTKENFEKGILGTELTLGQPYAMSYLDSEKFPRIDALLEYAKEHIGTKEYDFYSVNKNNYMLLQEVANRYVDKQSVWNKFNELRSNTILSLDSRGNHYSDNQIFFSINQNTDSFHVCRNAILYSGNVYESVDDFCKAYKRGISYDENTYGKDPLFLEGYISSHTYNNTISHIEREEECDEIER